MPIQYECENCNYTTENPPVDCVCPKCGGKLVAVKIKIDVPYYPEDDELTF